MDMGMMRGSDEIDDTKSQRSATNLAPFKKDLGNRFSTIRTDTRESFISVNPLARSAASTFKKGNEIFEDLNESRDSQQQVSGPIENDLMAQMADLR